MPNHSGTWYFVTAGVWAGYWLAAGAGVVVGPAPPSVAAESYRPWRPLTLAPGTYTGYRFDTYGNVIGSTVASLGAPAMVPTTEKSTIPNLPGNWFYVTAGTWSGYWIAEQPGTTLGTLPMAGFHSSLTAGIAPLSVAFTDTSITYGPASWKWDFDSNGTVDSTLQSPTFTYPAAGTYSVTMTVTDLIGTDTETMTNITVRDSQPGTYVPLPPTRVLDSRIGTGLAGAFAANVPRTFQVAGVGGVPAGAVAVTGTLTVTNQSGAGFVYLGPDPAPYPASSTVNFPAGDSRATGVTMALSPGGTLSATLGGGRDNPPRLRRDRLLRGRCFGCHVRSRTTQPPPRHPVRHRPCRGVCSRGAAHVPGGRARGRADRRAGRHGHPDCHEPERRRVFLPRSRPGRCSNQLDR